MRATIDIESIFSDKTNQRDAGFRSQFYGKTRWSSYRGNDSNAGIYRLLNKFKTGSPTEKQNGLIERQAFPHQHRSNELIESVMTPHIFPEFD